MSRRGKGGIGLGKGGAKRHRNIAHDGIEVEKKVHIFREELKKVEPNGIILTFLIGWLLYPLKFICEPVLGITEVMIPKMAYIIPFAGPVLVHVLDIITASGTSVIDVGKKIGILKESKVSDEDEGDEMDRNVFSEMNEFFFEGLSLQKSAVAFGFSVSIDFLTAALNPFKLARWVEAISGIDKFLYETGIGKELLVNAFDFLPNFIILGRTQDVFHDEVIKRNAESNTPTMTELNDGFRFMKYATAAYGGKTISAANSQQIGNDEEVTITNFIGDTGPGLAARLDIKDDLSRKYLVDTPSEFATRKKISQHVGIPESDMIMFVKPGGSTKVLRHFIAVDVKNEEVILALRGTYSFSELLIDASGETRDFCGGKAHSGIADVTDELWECCGDVVNAVLAGFPGYKLVICGHSLGAGAACLLTIKIYAEELLKPWTNVECMAFASPAVFTPLNAAERAISKATNFIHDNDCVSFLSAANTRELIDSIEVVDKTKGNLWQQFKVIMGFAKPSAELIKAVQISGKGKKEDVAGAERSFVPAKKIIWMRMNKNDEEYKSYHFLPEKLPEIYVNEDMIQDHFPPYYEETLNKLTDRK